MGDVHELFSGDPAKPEETPSACRAIHGLLIVQFDPERCSPECPNRCVVENKDGTQCENVPILNMGVHPPFSAEVEGPIHVCSDDGHIDYVATMLVSDIVDHEVGINLFDKIMETGAAMGLDKPTDDE